MQRLNLSEKRSGASINRKAIVASNIQQESEPRMDKLSLNHEPKSDHKSPNEVELERIEKKLRSVQLALEVMTGVCATLPDPEPEVAEDAGDEEDGNSKISKTCHRLMNHDRRSRYYGRGYRDGHR